MSDPNSAFEHWHHADKAKEFCEKFHPAVMTMASRLPNLQNYLSDHGLSLQMVAEGKAGSSEFRRTRYLAQADMIRTQLFAGFDRVIPPFLPELA